MAALPVRYFHGRAVIGQNKLPEIQKFFVHRTCQEDLAVDFTDDGQLGLENASGTVLLEIFDDGGSMILIEGRRLFAIALSFRRFLLDVAQVRQKIVAAWP